MITKAHSNMSFNKLQFIEYLTHDMNFIPNKNNSARAVFDPAVTSIYGKIEIERKM